MQLAGQRNSILLGLLILVVSAFWASSASATCTALGCDCTVSADAVPFGTYDAQSMSPQDAVGTINVTCTAILLGGEVSYEISIDEGGASSFSPRKLSGAQDDLDYNLYTDSGRTIVWGDGSGGTSTVTDGYEFLIGLVINRAYSVYGRIPTGQLVPADSYSDSLTVTIIF